MKFTLESLRVNQGLTQQEVADYLGVNRRTIYQWENGEQLPKKLVLYALSNLYTVDVEDIRTKNK